METKKCKDCGRELAITEFRMTRWGSYDSACRECISKKQAYTRHKNAIGGGKNSTAYSVYSDPEFDVKHPVEVIQLMKRAKMWLEAKGYNITLKGTYTQVMEVKF